MYIIILIKLLYLEAFEYPQKATVLQNICIIFYLSSSICQFMQHFSAKIDWLPHPDSSKYLTLPSSNHNSMYSCISMYSFIS